MLFIDWLLFALAHAQPDFKYKLEPHAQGCYGSEWTGSS